VQVAYRLTPKGAALVPALVSISAWAGEWLADEA